MRAAKRTGKTFIVSAVSFHSFFDLIVHLVFLFDVALSIDAIARLLNHREALHPVNVVLKKCAFGRNAGLKVEDFFWCGRGRQLVLELG